jgi:Xaa-Pro aminopeptidase
MEEKNLDALLVTHVPNIRYLTGFTGSAGVALVLRGEVVLFSDFRYREQAEEEVGASARVEIVQRSVWDRAVQVLGAYAGVAAVGYEAQVLTVREADRLAESAERRFELQPQTDLVERLRAKKDPQEVASIRAAAELAGEALHATLSNGVSAGRRERDVATVLEAELRRRGSEWHPFPTIVASGPRSALPHAQTTERVIEAGDLVLLDFGAQVDGYCADITRTVVVGRAANERQRLVYALVQEAQQRALDHLRAGVIGRDADALARSVIEARGFGDAFGHSLGHGLGLEVHEGPSLSRHNEKALPDGAVVTVEPGVYLPGWGGVRIEDDVHITAEGAALLSDGDTELRELI